MKTRTLALLLVMAILLAACGDRGSGFAPAENAVTANPEATIDLRARDYELPAAVPAPEGPTASYDTGDSSGGRTLTLDTLNPALERAAAETAPELADAVAENTVESGRSTTVADETSEGDAAAVTGGEQNVTTDTAETINDTVVEPANTETAAAVQNGDTGGATPTTTPETATEQPAVEQPVTAETGGIGSTEAATGGASATTTATTATQTDAIQTDAIQTDATQTTETQTTETQASTFDWQEIGATTYSGNCAACHQQNGEGVAGAFPPLAGHINELYNAEGGRKYIVNVVLYGLQGEISALGQNYNGIMNPWNQLSDEQIAATLNHELTSWGNDKLEQNFSPILPAEVEAERGGKLSAAQVLELRPQLP